MKGWGSQIPTKQITFLMLGLALCTGLSIADEKTAAGNTEPLPTAVEAPATGSTNTEATAVKTTTETAVNNNTAATESGFGLRVFVDPETGALTDQPTEAQLQALQENQQNKALLDGIDSPFSRSDEGLVPFALSNGGRGVNLQGRFHSATLVRINADGTFSAQCVDHPDLEAHIHDHPTEAEAALPLR